VLDAPGDHYAMVQPPCSTELAGIVDGILDDRLDGMFDPRRAGS